MTVFSIEIKRVRKLNRRTKLDHSRQLAYLIEFEGIERVIKMNEEEQDIVIYETSDGDTRLSVKLNGDTVWLSLNQMSVLFGRDKSTISRHIKNVFEEGELDQSSTVAKFATVQIEGGREVEREIEGYNLDVVISVGYRVKSQEGIRFRQWATNVLREYMVKGFTLDDERLKQGGGAYWRELLDRIRDIRSSEKVLYRQVLDLYALAVDYDPKAPESKKFFKIVQNKLHYGAHGHTAPEVIFDRADADKPFMGLTSFSGSQVTKKDIGVAKNYLSEEELSSLNALVSGYFDIAEFRAQRKTPTTMQDYIDQLDRVLEAADAPVLEGAGTRSHKQAINKAEKEYRAYQEKTLSPVEKEYLAELVETEKKLSKRRE